MRTLNKEDDKDNRNVRKTADILDPVRNNGNAKNAANVKSVNVRKTADVLAPVRSNANVRNAENAKNANVRNNTDVLVLVKNNASVRKNEDEALDPNQTATRRSVTSERETSWHFLLE